MIKIEDFVEALADSKVVHALTAIVMPCIKSCIKEELDNLNSTLAGMKAANQAQKR